MSKFRFFIVLALFCLSTSFLVSQGILPLSEIQPGMRGQGKTVFLGSKIERFDFEILGIQKILRPVAQRFWSNSWAPT
ncbi:MAG TPA: hypothetical protein DER35_00870 [Acidobacteria bacterium]|nr:hypothetical protein [Acidobacteriota bacterium]